MDSLIDGLENNKFADLKDDFEEIVLSKVNAKVEEKTAEILNNINGVEKVDDNTEINDNDDSEDDDKEIENSEDDSKE